VSDENGSRLVAEIVRRMPTAVWVALIGQIVAFSIWLVKLDGRTSENAERIAALEARYSLMDERDTRAGNIVKDRVDHMQRVQEWLVAIVLGVQPPQLAPPDQLKPEKPK